MTRMRLRIPQPKVRPGDAVSVVNYRRRPAVWEAGRCKRAHFVLAGGGDRPWSGSWQYTIVLDRLPALRLYVGDARVEPDA